MAVLVRAAAAGRMGRADCGASGDGGRAAGACQRSCESTVCSNAWGNPGVPQETTGGGVAGKLGVGSGNRNEGVEFGGVGTCWVTASTLAGVETSAVRAV